MAEFKVLTEEGVEYLVEKIDEKLDKKVDAVEGKGLSTNDFTDAYKESIDNLAGSGGYFNPIQKIKVNGVELPIEDTSVNIDLSGYVDESDLKGKSDVGHTHSEYALKNDLNGKSDVGHTHDNYALKNQIPDISGLATKNDLNGKADANHTHSNYALKSDIPDISGKADVGHTHDNYALKSQIPDVSGLATKTELSNGLGGKVDKVNGSRLMTTAEASKISKLADDPNGTYATKGDLSTIPKLNKTLVSELPTQNIDENTIYLVPNGNTGTNACTEYLYIDGKWEVIGSTEVDLSSKADADHTHDEYLPLTGGQMTGTIETTGALISYDTIGVMASTILPWQMMLASTVLDTVGIGFVNTSNNISLLGVKGQEPIFIPDVDAQPMVSEVLAYKSEIPDVSGFALKTEIPDVSGLASKSDLNGKADTSHTHSEYALKSDVPTITVSSSPPSGGKHGDIWLQYEE